MGHLRGKGALKYFERWIRWATGPRIGQIENEDEAERKSESKSRSGRKITRNTGSTLTRLGFNVKLREGLD